jgi:hypothetical protein
MSNKQQTAVEWCIDELYKLNVKFLNSRYGNQMTILEYSDCKEQIKKKAKEMEKEQTRDDIKNELKLIGNYFDVDKLDQREQGHHIRFTSILKDRFDFYNETYGGNK